MLFSCSDRLIPMLCIQTTICYEKQCTCFADVILIGDWESLVLLWEAKMLGTFISFIVMHF